MAVPAVWPVWAGLAVGVLGFALGTVANPTALLPMWRAASWYGVAGVALGALIAAIAQRLSRRAFPVALGLGSAIVVATFGVGPFFSVALILLASFALGSRVLEWSEDAGPSRDVDDISLRTTVGLAVNALLLAFAAHWRISILATALAWAALGLWLGRASVFTLWRYVVQSVRVPRPVQVPLALRFLLWLAFGMYVAYSALPERYHDALAMHLVIPRALELFGFWHFDVQEYTWAVQPMGANWLIGWAYLLSGEYAAKLLNASYLLLMSGVMLESRTLPRSMGFLAVAILVFTPLTFIVTASVFVDGALALFIVATVVYAARIRDVARASSIAGFALAAAAAIAVKAHGLVAITAAVASVVALGGWRHVFRVRGRALLICLLAGAAAAWPYTYAWYKTGNPIFPYFNGFFKSPFFPAENFENELYPGGLFPTDLYNLTFFGSKHIEGLDGALGFALTLLLPAGLLLVIVAGSRKLRVIALAALIYTMLVLLNTRYLRYLYPVLPLFALLMVYPLAMLDRPYTRNTYLGVMVVAMMFSVFRIPAAGWILGEFDPLAAFSAQAKERIVDRQVPARRLGRIQSALGDNNSRVVVFGQSIGADIKGRPLYVDWYYYKLYWLTSLTTPTPDEAASTLAAINASYVIFDRRFAKPTWAPWEAGIRRYGKLIATVNNADLYEFHAGSVPGRSLFKSGAEGWRDWAVDPPVAPAEPGDTLVLKPGAAVSRPADIENVPAGTAVTLSVEQQCAMPTKIRVQMNWLNADGSPLHADAVHVECVNELRHGSLRIARPKEAHSVYFYFTNDGDAEATLTEPHASAWVAP